MRQQIDANVGIHNEFTLVLKNSKGKIKQQVKAYNIVLDRVWTNSVYSGTIEIGTGTGIPTPDRDGLFNFLSRTSTFIEGEYYAEKIDTKTNRYVSTLVRSFAAGTGTGLITEVGLRGMTHAMLQDAEGNPISIEKTDTDILEITSILYLQSTVPDYIYRAPLNTSSPLLFNLVSNHSTGNANASSLISMYITWYLCDIPYIFEYSLNSWLPLGTMSWIAGKEWHDSLQRIQSATYNDNYINAIYLANTGSILLPNETFFPKYRTAETLVGYGDGVNNSFNTPIPSFLENTEQLKVNNVLLTRNIDYTIDNKANPTLNLSANSSGIFKVTIDTELETASTALGIFISSLDVTGYVDINNYYEYTFDRPVTFDTCLLGRHRVGLNGAIDGNYNLVVEYLDDVSGIWLEILNVSDYVSSGWYYWTTTVNHFDAVTATKWRYKIHNPNSAVHIEEGIRIDNVYSLLYRGNPIVFTEPPALDALVTISVEVDRPWKTADYVIDIEGSLTFEQI